MRIKRVSIVAAVIFAFAVLAYPLTAGAVVTWNKNANAVLSGGGNYSTDFDFGGIERPMVIIDGANSYKMYYTGKGMVSGTPETRVLYASSSNGINWTADHDTPLIGVGGPGAFDEKHTGFCWVIKDGTTYKMWYSGNNYSAPDGPGWQVGYAESANGTTWVKYGSNPVLLRGTGDDWDADGLGAPTVIKDGTLYKMWYVGWNDAQGTYGIGYAESPDGISWVKYNNPSNNGNPPFANSDPVLTPGNAGSWDSYEAEMPSVIKEGGVYRMWYYGIQSKDTPDTIGYASSYDGINWNKYQGNPVMMSGQPGSLDEYGAWNPVVAKDGNTYKMWYIGSSDCSEGGECLDQVGYAESTAYQGPEPRIINASVVALNRSPGDGGPQLMFNVIPLGPSPVDVNALYVQGPNGFVRSFNESEIRDVMGEQVVRGGFTVASFDLSYNGTYTFWFFANNGQSVSRTIDFTIPSTVIPYPVDGAGGLDRRIVLGGPDQGGVAEYISGTTPTFKWKPYLGADKYYRVSVRDPKQPYWFRCWYQSPFTIGSSVDGSGFMSATVPEGHLKPNSNYLWEIEASTTDQFWTTQHIARSTSYAFFTAPRGSNFLPNGSVYVFGQRSFSGGDQTIFGAKVAGLARWGINDTPAPFQVLEGGVAPYYQFRLNNAQGNDLGYYVLQPSPANDYSGSTLGIAGGSTLYRFSVSDGSTSDTQDVTFVPNLGVPQVTKKDMIPVDNSYLNTLEPTFTWKSKGLNFYHRVRIASWIGLNIYQSNWQNGITAGTEMSAVVPPNVLQSGVYRWWVEVADTSGGAVVNRTQSQRLTFMAIGTLGSSMKDELILNFGPTYGLWQYDQTHGWQQWNPVAPSQVVPVDLNGDGTDELVAAFTGYGLYAYGSTNGWQQINAVIPEAIMRAGTSIVCDYGAYGLWHWEQATGWQQLNPVDPGLMVTVDFDNDGEEEGVISFAGYGLYTYEPDTNTWTQINTVSPDVLMAQGNGIVCDYGVAYGLWSWTLAGGWQQLNAADPGLMVAVDVDSDGQDELIVGFSGYGLYTYDPAAGWFQINPVVPDAMIRRGNGIAADYGPAYGLWSWSQGGGWQQLNAVDPGQMTVVDIDKDGVEELVVSFSGYGLYYLDETNGWQLLNGAVPAAMKPLNFYP